MAAAWVVDEDGERRRFLVRGFDRVDPQRVVVGQIEVRPGGMMVFHTVDDRPFTLSPPPEEPEPAQQGPSASEVREEREERAREAAEREREAARIERMAAEEAAKKRATKKEPAAS